MKGVIMFKKLFVLLCIMGLVVSCANGVYKQEGHIAMTDMCPEEAVALATTVLNVTVYFNFDRDLLLDKGIAQLKGIAAKMLEEEDLNVVVEGHTDRIGTDSYNLALSKKRASVVKLFLAAQGVNPDRITTIGLGETNLVSKTNWENRRAVVISVD
jgi:outer membrane protein OmpA-like peptidoglycan-associated protein